MGEWVCGWVGGWGSESVGAGGWVCGVGVGRCGLGREGGGRYRTRGLYPLPHNLLSDGEESVEEEAGHPLPPLHEKEVERGKRYGLREVEGLRQKTVEDSRLGAIGWREQV